jgi:hypothetical protein
MWLLFVGLRESCWLSAFLSHRDLFVSPRYLKLIYVIADQRQELSGIQE